MKLKNKKFEFKIKSQVTLPIVRLAGSVWLQNSFNFWHKNRVFRFVVKNMSEGQFDKFKNKLIQSNTFKKFRSLLVKNFINKNIIEKRLRFEKPSLFSFGVIAI